MPQSASGNRAAYSFTPKFFILFVKRLKIYLWLRIIFS
jgi:hypothetical protein